MTAIRALGGLFVAVVVLLAAVAVSAQVATREERTTLSYEGVRRIVVTGGSGDVRLRGAPTAGTEVHRVVSRSWSRPQGTESLVDGVLTLSSDCPVGLFVGCSETYDIAAPVEVSVSVRTGTGDVSLSGVSGDIEARTGTGDVDLIDVTARRVDATAATGDVEVRLTGAPDLVTARSATGDVLVVLPRGDGAPYDVVAGAGTGETDVAVSTSASSSQHVLATAATGDVTVRYRE